MIRLGLVTLVVPDYDEAIEFFVQALGMTLTSDCRIDANKRWVTVHPQGQQTGILLARAKDATQLEVVGRQAGPRVGFFLFTNNFEGDYHRMSSQGVVFEEAPRVEPYGVVAVFKDPFGNRWDLIMPSD